MNHRWRVRDYAAGSEADSPVKKFFSSFLLRNEKPRGRFYLLPGQSGRAFRRKQKFILLCSVAVGLLVAGIVGLALFLMCRAPK